MRFSTATEAPGLKRTLLLAATAVLLTQQAFAGPWLTSLPEAQKKAKKTTELILVDMFADWCGWCHRMEQEVFPSEAFQKATDGKVLLRLNTEDGADGTRLAQQYSVTALPTFLLLTPNLTIAGVIHGYFPPTPFVAALKDVEGRYQRFQTLVANESSIQGDYAKRLELATEFRDRYAFADSETRLSKLVGERDIPANIRDQAYYELALTQVMERKYDDGLKTIRRFGSVESKGDAYEKSRLLAGDIYVQQGNYKSALSEFQSFKTAFPKSQYIPNVDAVLPQLQKRVATRVQ